MRIVSLIVLAAAGLLVAANAETTTTLRSATEDSTLERKLEEAAQQTTISAVAADANAQDDEDDDEDEYEYDDGEYEYDDDEEDDDEDDDDEEEEKPAAQDTNNAGRRVLERGDPEACRKVVRSTCESCAMERGIDRFRCVSDCMAKNADTLKAAGCVAPSRPSGMQRGGMSSRFSASGNPTQCQEILKRCEPCQEKTIIQERLACRGECLKNNMADLKEANCRPSPSDFHPRSHSSRFGGRADHRRR